MSHSSVSRGFQSCLEPRHIEPHVLRLKLAPPGSNHSSQSEWPNSDSSSSTNASFSNSKEAYENPISDNNTNNEHDMKRVKDSSEAGDGCTRSFLQSLSNISYCNNKAEAESVYVHPKVKCSSSMLSAKSLEMCTESLGCETGSNASESSDEMSLFPLENNSTSSMSNNTIQVNTNYEPKTLNRGNDFPPPLTSITDLGGLHVRPHREGGRLILEAVTRTSFQPYFHAERSNGRLRLRLFESVASYCGDEGEEVAEEEEQEEGEMLNNEACDEEENVAEEGLEKYAASVEDEMGMAKFTTPSRCKESGRNRDIFGELPSLSVCL